MSAPPKSRWATEDPETEAIVAQQKQEKEAKKRAKAERQRKLEETDRAQKAADAQKQQNDALNEQQPQQQQQQQQPPPTKRRRLSNDHPSAETTASPAEAERQQQQQKRSTLLPFPMREWGPCRHVDNFERLNHIEEGSYGWVSRAKDITSNEVVALKKLKMENSADGFPVTGLREIQTLLEARHPNVVYLREIVIGNKVDE